MIIQICSSNLLPDPDMVQESSGIKTEMTVNRGSGTKKDKFSTDAIALGLSLA